MFENNNKGMPPNNLPMDDSGRIDLSVNQEPEDMFEAVDHIDGGSQEKVASNISSENLGTNMPQGQTPRVEAVYSEPSSKIKKIILIIIIILAVAGIGYGMFWYYNKLLSAKMNGDAMQNISKPQEKTVMQKEDTTNTQTTKQVQENDTTTELPPSTVEETPTTISNTVTGTATIQTPTVPDPALLDSDNDGLTDQEEAEYGTDPKRVDTDADGLFDKEEIQKYKTDPLDSDTDGDGYSDGSEVKNGYNPAGPGTLNFQIPNDSQ